MKQPSFTLALLLTACAACAEPAADLYVAPGGNDAWSGRSQSVHAGLTDGPLATLDAARDKVRQIRKADPARSTPVVVMLFDGTYELNSPFTLTADDSGTARSPTLYTAAPRQCPLVSGGTLLKDGWARTSPGVMRLTIPDVKAGRWNFTQLFVDGHRRQRPRWPTDTYASITAAAAPTAGEKKGKGDDRFRFAAGDIHPDWHNLADVEVITFHPWFTSNLRIESVDAKDRLVTFTGRTRTDASYGQLKAKLRYLVENVQEELKTPGQWYLDRPTGQLTYLPLPHEQLSPAPVVAPRLDKLVVLDGNPDAPVQFVTFRGLTFAHTNWVTPPDGISMPQAATQTPGAIFATAARHCSIDDCTVTLTGGYAIELAAGCQDNVVQNCRLTDLGAGGIKLGSAAFTKDPHRVVTNNTLRENLIAHAGRLHPGAVGVWVGHADHCTVEHNDIYDLYYTGISVGWRWGYGPSGAHDNLIRLNHIHHLGQGVLSDMGGIYTLGLSPGTVLNLNLIHDVTRYSYGGWGIYFDEGTSDILAENNLVYRTQDGFHQHYGQQNTYRNNINGPSANAQITGNRIQKEDRKTIQDQNAFTYDHNIVYGWNGPSPQAVPFPDEKLKPFRELYALHHNLYWNDGRQVVVPPRDKDALVADPLFIDPANDDYRLKPDSPALKLGFKPFDITPAGRSSKEPPDLDPTRWPRFWPPTSNTASERLP